MNEHSTPEAWVNIPTNEELQALRAAPQSGPRHPYDFGFFPAMGRLIMAHSRIAPAFGTLFSQIMFSPEGRLERREREMVAAVAAAAQDCHY